MAADDKKPKIDLKARLGKATGPATGLPAPVGRISSVVPPPASAPPGAAIPPPTSVPPPSFGSAAPAAGNPAFAPVKPPDPFGARVAAPAMAPQPASFKIVLDEEVARAQRSGNNKRSAMFGVVALAVGGIVGAAFGMRYSDSGQTQIAITGAKELIADIDKSQAKIKELAEKIGAATKDLKDKKFPASFAHDLEALSIPFAADKLYGKGIGRFRDSTLRLLFSYTQSIESLNDRKDALKNLFSAQQKPITEALVSASNPKVAWAVFVQKSPAHGPVAILAPIDPGSLFSYKDNWPARFTINAGRDKVETTRWEKGDLFSTESKVFSIPLEPDSVTSTFPNDIVSRITSELVKTDTVLRGGSEEDVGILRTGEQLLAELRKIGSK